MTHDMRSMAEPFLGVSAEHVQHMRILAARVDPRTATGPPWSWANLTDEENVWLDKAIVAFVIAYNDTYTSQLDHVIPPCWRDHPALAAELPVQLWAWWAAHVDEQSTVAAALEFYDRHLPAFKSRLSVELLGRGAVNCRKGRHTGGQADPSPAV